MTIIALPSGDTVTADHIIHTTRYTSHKLIRVRFVDGWEKEFANDDYDAFIAAYDALI